MELEVLGKTTTRVKLNYTITACVAYFSNAASLDNLEQLIISILGALNASKYELSTVDRPSVTTKKRGLLFLCLNVDRIPD